MKKVEVTSCSHSQGRPISRVTMSQITDVQKPASVTPHSTISTPSSQSSDFHLRWRWRVSTSSGFRLAIYLMALISCWILAACGPRSLAIFSR